MIVRSPCYALLAIVSLIGSAPMVHAQSGRKIIGRPVLRPHSVAPSAVVRQLRFSEEKGKLWLYSAGDDKVVRKWEVAGQAEKELSLRPHGDPLRWPAYRDASGIIYALAPKPEREGKEPLLAVGGLGIKQPMVNLFDPRERDFTHVLLHPETKQREAIVYALDFHPAGTLLAVGHGGNARAGQPGRGDAKVLLWSLEPAAEFQQALDTGLDRVRFARFNSDGDRLAIATDHPAGIIQIWELTGHGPEVKLTKKEVQPLGSSITALAWVDRRTLAAGTQLCDVVRVLETDGGLTLNTDVTRITNRTGVEIGYHVKGPRSDWSAKRRQAAGQTVELTEDHHEPVEFFVIEVNQREAKRNLKAPPGSQWDVIVAGPGMAPEFASARPMVSALEFAGKSPLLLAALIDPKNYSGQVARRSLDGGPLAPLAEDRFASDVSALAASPDGRYLAAAGVDRLSDADDSSRIQIRIWSNETGQKVAQFPLHEPGRAAPVPASPAPSTPALRGPQLGAGPICTVAIVAGTGTDAIAYGMGPHRYSPQVPPPSKLFRLEYPRRIEKAPQQQAPLIGTGASDIAYRSDGFHLESGKLGPIPYPVDRTKPLCYVRFKRGNLDAVAIGYTAGILVWDLNALRSGKAADPVLRSQAVLRRFYGHEGLVTCLAVSQDATWLVSGSDDGTICAWSLRDIEAAGTARCELGVQLELTAADQLVIKQVDPKRPACDPAKPGWEAGFEAGQEIVDLLVANEAYPPPLKDGRQWTARQRKEWWKYKLEQPTPGEELTVWFKGMQAPVVTTVSHDPLWTLYPQQGDEWVLWTPPGIYDATLAGRLGIVWHVNPPIASIFNTARPQAVFSLPRVAARTVDEFGEDFYSPQNISGLIDDRDAGHFLQVAKGKLLDTDDLPPSIKISELPTLRSDDDSAEVTVHVEGKRLRAVELWLNSKRIARNSDRPHEGLQRRITGKDMRLGPNQVFVVAASGDEQHPQYSRESRGFREPFVRESPVRRLHYVGVGVTHWESAAAHAVQPLKFAANDAHYLGEALRKLVANGSVFDRAGEMIVLHSEAGIAQAAGRPITPETRPTRPNIVRVLQSLAQQAGPDDFICLCFSGHGFNEFTENSREFYFAMEDTTDDLARTGLSHTELYNLLAELPCPTLLLVDACHAGGIKADEQLLNLGGRQLGPTILTSCRAGELSKEFPDVRLSGERRGHGIFTAAVIQALIDGPGGPDRLDTVEKVCHDVEQRVPRLAALLLNGNATSPPAGNFVAPTQHPQTLHSISFPAGGVRLR